MLSLPARWLFSSLFFVCTLSLNLQITQAETPTRGKKATAAPTKDWKSTLKNVAYGPHERNMLDLYLLDAEEPAPLIVCIHGGGFVAGSKEKIAPQFLNAAREKGFSVASINYRFVTTDMFPAPQQDGARAIQFLRCNASKYNLDEERFAAFGGSAGAGISMWLAYHDDLANPLADDPIARASSRVQAVGSIGGQSSYDPFVLKDWIGGKAYMHPSVFLCYRVLSIDQLSDPKLQPLYDEVSAIKHVSADDPPTFMYYSEPDQPLPANSKPGEGIHHPIFGHKLKAELDRAGIESEYYHASHAGRDWGTLLLDFFEQKMAATPQETAGQTQ